MLSRRERQVAEGVAQGSSNYEIALELGIAESTVATYAARARRKLHVASRVELARSQSPRSHQASDFADRVATLTPSERDVALRACKGSSNLAIAEARDSHKRTVANQLASIYRKLRISCRTELATHAEAIQPTPLHLRLVR